MKTVLNFLSVTSLCNFFGGDKHWERDRMISLNSQQNVKFQMIEMSNINYRFQIELRPPSSVFSTLTCLFKAHIQ